MQKIITLFAYEISPIINPDRLYFAATLDECRSAARQQRKELRADPDYGFVYPMPIYRVDLELPELQALLEGLNETSNLAKAITVDRKLIETIRD